jgi:DHA1 family bicyclomycin/chloramphenicol resistance-like MFS transporter
MPSPTLRPTPVLGAQAMSPMVVIVALSLLLGLQPVATDLYLPALPQMQRELGVSQADAQWTLSGVVLAFGMAQLIWGPVSDRVGRRPVLLWGLSLFVLASVCTVFAPSLSLMMLGRVGQGLGLAAAVVCARAMVRDLFEPTQGARVLSKGLSGLGVIALVGPLLGGFAAAWFGWRATLALVGVFALAGLVFIALRMRETLPAHRQQASMAFSTRLGQWHLITRQPMFRAYTALTSSTYGGLYVFLAASSFVFIDVLHLSRPLFGALMASMSLGYLIGTMVCRRLLPRLGLAGSVRIAAMLSACAGVWCIGLSLLSLGLGFTPAALAVMPGLWMYAVAHGVHQPCSQAGVVAAFPQQAGAASALSGFIMSVLAFGISGLLSAWMKMPDWAGTIHPLTMGAGAGALVTAWVGLGRVQRDGTPPASAPASLDADA